MTDSLGQTFDTPGYRIFAVDNDGFSTKFQPLNTWPAVIITNPIDRGLTIQAFDIPNNSQAVPIRALVFDQNPVTSVEYRIDGGNWVSMNSVSGTPNLWNSSFDASSLTDTEHTITVRALSSSGTTTDSLTIRVGQHDTPEKINGALPDFTRIKNCDPWILDLTMFEWDRIDQGAQLNWSINSADPSLCLVEMTDILNDLVTFTPVQDAVGTVDVFFTLNNTRGTEVTGYITITLVDVMELATFQSYLGIIALAAIVIAVVINFLLMKKSGEPLPNIKK